jgi:hypothetical protein
LRLKLRPKVKLMTAAYQDKRITILDEGITVGDKAFTMNLVNHATVTSPPKRSAPPWTAFTFFLVLSAIPFVGFLVENIGGNGDSIFLHFLSAGLFGFASVLNFFLLMRCLWLKRLVYQLTLDISGNNQIVLSSKDKDYIHMLAGLINTFKGYTPHPEPSFDYEGEVLE